MTASSRKLPLRIPVILLLSILFGSCVSVQARSFRGEGSDLLMGVGAGNIALGGAVVAGSHDLFSVYWNPAGLAEIAEGQVALSKQLDGRLDPVSFAGIAVTHPRLTIGGVKTVLAYSWIPRLHIKARGKYTSEDFESIFTNYALPGLPTDFDGAIESKTREHRLTLALAPAVDPAWSLGINVGRVDCGTDFCGTFAEDPGNYTIASTGATAITVGLGAKYRPTDRLTLAINLKDIDTRLDVETIVTDAAGTRRRVFATRFPHELTAGVLLHTRQGYDLTADLQYLFGEYGDTRVDFKIVRFGLEKWSGALSYRCGLVVPLLLDTSTRDFRDDLPSPLLPTVGIGYALPWADIDFAVYPNPLLSTTNDRVEISTDLSFAVKF